MSGRRSIFRSRSSSAAHQGGSNHGDYSNSSMHSNSEYKIQEVNLENNSAAAPRRFQRRGSLDLKAVAGAGGGGGGGTGGGGRRSRSFMFQRRGSLNSAAPPPSEQPAGSGSLAEQPPPPRRRMFRRDSMGQRPSSDTISTAPSEDSLSGMQTTASSTGSLPPPKPFRRGSFGPRGDSNPPRPVRRRASIGQESAAAAAAVATDFTKHDFAASTGDIPLSSGSAAVSTRGYDFHNDSIVMTEPPRRVARRASLSDIDHHRERMMQQDAEAAAAAAAPKQQRKKGLFRKENFVNPFRRHHHHHHSSNSSKASDPASPVGSTTTDESLSSARQQLGAPPIAPPSPTRSARSVDWKPEHQDIMEDEELLTASPSLPERSRTVRFASEPQIHIMDFTLGANCHGAGPECSAMSPLDEVALKAKLWWNSEEMAQIRQECMDLVKDYLDDTEYMEAVTKLFSSHKKSVSPEDVEAAIEVVSHRTAVRGLEMHICPRGGLLCEKHRRIVLTNVASTTVDGLSNTGEGWLLIRKESMKASRSCRQYAMKMAEHDFMEAVEARMSSWAREEDDDSSESSEELDYVEGPQELEPDSDDDKDDKEEGEAAENTTETTGDKSKKQKKKKKRKSIPSTSKPDSPPRTPTGPRPKLPPDTPKTDKESLDIVLPPLLADGDNDSQQQAGEASSQEEK